MRGCEELRPRESPKPHWNKPGEYFNLNWVEQLTPEQRARWNDRSREPFHLFKTMDEELAATTAFWRSRTPHERLEYLEHTRCVIYGEQAVNAKMVRCYGWRRRVEDEYDPKNVVYF